MFKKIEESMIIMNRITEAVKDTRVTSRDEAYVV